MISRIFGIEWHVSIRKYWVIVVDIEEPWNNQPPLFKLVIVIPSIRDNVVVELGTPVSGASQTIGQSRALTHTKR